MKVLRLFSVLIILSVLMFAACSSSDTTKVTIYFSKDKQASLEQIKLPLIDRIFNLFSSKVYAQTIHETSDTEYYELLVFADDFDGTYAIVPGTASSISIEVPSGNNRTFLLYSISPNGNINYLGQTVTNLTGGDTSISINMYPCLNNIEVTNPEGIYINWSFDPTLDTKFNYITIYRACIGTDTVNCDGNFIILDTLYPIGNGSYNDSTISPLQGNSYYYFLTVNTGSFGGGGIQVPTNLQDLQFYNSVYYIGNVWNFYYYPIF